MYQGKNSNLGFKRKAEREKLYSLKLGKQASSAKWTLNQPPMERLLELWVHTPIKGIVNPPSSLENLQANKLF